MNDTEALLRPLLRFLDASRPYEAVAWQEWRIEPIIGGWNSLLYRATTTDADVAVKFTVADERDRAGREYEALSAITDHGIDITPNALLLDREGLSQPVMVQSWLGGTVSTELPTADDDWACWVAHMAAIHAVTPDNVTGYLRSAVLTAFSVDEAKTLVDSHLQRVPLSERPPELTSLVNALARTPFPHWARPEPSLCRVDSAIQNFVRRTEKWLSVDWENAGWGDPAFEIADLLCHAANMAMSPERQRWFVEHYCEQSADPAIATRIWTYQKILLVWWAVRTYRYLYEMPRGLDMAAYR